MHDLQKTIDGRWESVADYTAKELLAVTSDLKELSTSERARIAWMTSPVVHAFLKTACGIHNVDAMHTEYEEHLKNLPAFETMSRQARKGDSPVPTPTQKKAYSPPHWYDLYRQSPHWKKLRHKAKQYYGGCVLCGFDENLECHHRHYLTVGSEAIRDLSILCGNHHKAVGRMLGTRVPKECPDNVEVLLKRWGLLND